MSKKKKKEKDNINNSLNNLADDFKKVGKDFTNVYKEHVFNKNGFKNGIRSLRGNKQGRQGKFLATVLVGITIFLLILSKVGIPIALILLFLVFLLLIEDK